MTYDDAVADMNFISKDEWDGKVEAIRKKGERFAKKMRIQGKPLKAEILGPREVPVGEELTMPVILIQRDWKAETKLEMVEEANNFLTKARQVGILHPDLLAALRATL